MKRHPWAVLEDIAALGVTQTHMDGYAEKRTGIHEHLCNYFTFSPLYTPSWIPVRNAGDVHPERSDKAASAARPEAVKSP
jgi:hypothetical protein